jgi:hypothetical protein
VQNITRALGRAMEAEEKELVRTLSKAVRLLSEQTEQKRKSAAKVRKSRPKDEQARA